MFKSLGLFLLIIFAQSASFADVREHVASLIVAKDWNNPTVNAFASKDGNNWKITFMGGFARHELMDMDA